MNCSVKDCANAATRRTMCTMHYQRWRRHGDPTVLRPGAARGCTIDGCERDHYARGWCTLHWARWSKTGDPLTVRPHFSPIAGKTRDRNPAWVGDDAGYGAVHRRLSKLRGPASAHSCPRCGGPAAEWAYTHDDPLERQSEEGPFSVDPDRYTALCVADHRAFDQAHREAVRAD